MDIRPSLALHADLATAADYRASLEDIRLFHEIGALLLFEEALATTPVVDAFTIVNPKSFNSAHGEKIHPAEIKLFWRAADGSLTTLDEALHHLKRDSAGLTEYPWQHRIVDAYKPLAAELGSFYQGHALGWLPQAEARARQLFSDALASWRLAETPETRAALPIQPVFGPTAVDLARQLGLPAAAARLEASSIARAGLSAPAPSLPPRRAL